MKHLFWCTLSKWGGKGFTAATVDLVQWEFPKEMAQVLFWVPGLNLSPSPLGFFWHFCGKRVPFFLPRGLFKMKLDSSQASRNSFWTSWSDRWGSSGCVRFISRAFGAWYKFYGNMGKAQGEAAKFLGF